MLKISIIISVYNSHEIVRRQIEWWKQLELPDDVEIILIDDGSYPAIKGEMFNLSIYKTNNNLAWTQGLGRNLGAEKAQGRYLFMTDIDHIISSKAINDVYNFDGNKMIFRRQIGVLDKDGNVKQDKETLKDWGYENKDLDASVHGNTFAMRKETFDALGGYKPKHSLIGYHPVSHKGDDCYFNAKWNKMFRGEKPTMGSDIYMFPIGRFNKDCDLNPKGLFHDLSQTRQDKFYKNGL